MADLHQRARDVLARLSVVAEGTATAWDPVAQPDRPTAAGPGLRTRIAQPTAPAGGHAPAESREPVNLRSIDMRPSGEHAPPKERSLHDHWRWKFKRAWHDRDRLLYYVLLAEEDLASRHHPSARGALEVPEGTILTFRGSVPEAAARFGVQMAYVRTLRRNNRRDPETGEPWLWPSSDERSALSSAARERLRAEALGLARGMLAEDESQRRVSEATGIPRATLQRLFGAGSEPPPESLVSTPEQHADHRQ